MGAAKPRLTGDELRQMRIHAAADLLIFLVLRHTGSDSISTPDHWTQRRFIRKLRLLAGEPKLRLSSNLKYVNFPDMQYLMAALSLNLQRCADVLDEVLTAFNEQTGIPERIVAWNTGKNTAPKVGFMYFSSILLWK